LLNQSQRKESIGGSFKARHKFSIAILSIFMVIAFSGCSDSSTSLNQTQTPVPTSGSATSAAPPADTPSPISQEVATLTVDPEV
jgi:hypothetical protein